MCALVAILSFSKRGFGGAVLSIVAVVPQLVVYMALQPKDVIASRQLPPLVDEKGKVATDLRRRVMTMLAVVVGVQIITFGFGQMHILRALFVGVAKAMAWFCILQTVRNSGMGSCG